jgi:hypothetical protein
MRWSCSWCTISEHTSICSFATSLKGAALQDLWSRYLKLAKGLILHGWFPLIVLATILLFLIFFVVILPRMLLEWDLSPERGSLQPVELAKATNDVRTTLLQGLGGGVLLLGAYFTWRQLHVSREGQITERFTRAIVNIGDQALDVRLGGIYALERITRDSPADRATVAEVLCAYVRTHSPWPPKLEGQPSVESSLQDIPELRVRAPDVQAALTVFSRNKLHGTVYPRLDLSQTDLRKAELFGFHLASADLVCGLLKRLFGPLIDRVGDHRGAL